MSSDDDSPPPSLGGALWVLVVAGWAIACLHYPLGRDQGVFSWVGDVIASGGVPYRDAWEVKGPLLYYVFGALRALTGPGIVGIRAFDLVLLALGYRATRQVGGPGAARLLVLWYASGTYWDTCQADGWIGLLLVGWVAWLDQDPWRSASREMAGTALVGAIVLGLKPPLVVLGALYPIYLVCSRGERGIWALGRGLGAAAGAGILGAIGAAALDAAGGLEPMMEIYRGFLMGDYAEVYPAGMAVFFARAGRFFMLTPQFPLALLVIAAAAWYRPSHRTLFWVAWVALGTACVAAQGRYFSYHWRVLFPPLAVLVHQGLMEQSRRESWRGKLGSVLAVVTWVLAGGLPATEAVRTLRYYLRGQSRAEYVRGLGGPEHYPKGDYVEAAAWIEEHVPEGSPVMLWGLDAAVNALTGRPAVGRWGLTFRLYVNPHAATRSAYRAEFLEAFDADPPGAVLLVQGDAIPYLKPKESRAYLAEFPELEARLEEGYRPAARFGRVDVLVPGRRRRTVGEPDPPDEVTPAPPDATTPRPEAGAPPKEG
jgi:hypothetical protein